jgi:hypothetical protein
MINLVVVDVSGDDGKTWTTAALHQPAADISSNGKVWGWCLWSVTIATKRNTRIVSRAGKYIYIQQQERANSCTS